MRFAQTKMIDATNNDCLSGHMALVSACPKTKLVRPFEVDEFENGLTQPLGGSTLHVVNPDFWSQIFVVGLVGDAKE